MYVPSPVIGINNIHVPSIIEIIHIVNKAVDCCVCKTVRPERVGGLMASDLERDLKAMILPSAADQKMRTIGGKNTPPPRMPKLGMDVSICLNS